MVVFAALPASGVIFGLTTNSVGVAVKTRGVSAS